MAPKKETYHNLLEFSIRLDEDPQVAGNGEEIFEALMFDYFFKYEADDKSIQTLLKQMDTPFEFKNIHSLRELSADTIREMVEGDTINDTFAAKIMLSKRYLRSFYPHHEPEYKKLPTEVQMELLDKIKEKNHNIIYAFEKMARDLEADRNRTLIRLIALCIRNVHLKTGFPLKKPKTSVEEVIKDEYPDYDKIFNADPKVMTDLNDDKKVKKLVKELFMIKQHKDIVDVANLMREEYQRYEQRLLKTS